jgi:hypothetical protein
VVAGEGKCDKSGLPITILMGERTDDSGTDDLRMFFRWSYGFYLSGCLFGLGVGIIAADMFGLSQWVGLAVIFVTIGFIILYGRWNTKHGVSRMVIEKVSRDRMASNHDEGGGQQNEGVHEADKDPQEPVE